MTFTNKNNNFPKSVTFAKKENAIKLIVKGQGVFIFENQNTNECSFKIFNKDQSNGLNITFTSTNVLVNYIVGNEPLPDMTNSSGLTINNGAYYWFSLDSHNQRLCAGIGEARIDTMIYQFQFELSKLNNSFLESLVMIQLPFVSSINPLKLLRDPIKMNIPLFVVDTNHLTMMDIASNRYLPSAFLSNTSQQLHNCISGLNFVLNTDDFPDFAKAIEYSIKTPGCWCHETLKSKSTEFNPDKPNLLETYLRITLGHNNGESPGVPYVMEIWPPQHYSPIHNHGGSSAVIRVLHGEINVSLYPYLSTDNVEPFGKEDFGEEDITWISPTLNQVHQLRNLSNENTCVTIQCYMYENDNNTHYNYFDYVDDDGKIQQFEPDSDMDFITFKETIQQQWNARPHILEKEESIEKSSCWRYIRSFFN
jgi:hypothetical protein